MAIQYTSSQLLKKISDNNYSYTSTFNKKIQESDSNVEKLQKEVDVLKNDVRKMKKYSNGIASKTMVEKYLKKFVKSYNSMKKAAGDVTDKDVKKQLEKLDEHILKNEKDLKKIGIKKSLKGEISFNEEKFKDAENKDIDKLFTGRTSFISIANKLMNNVDKSTNSAQNKLIDHKIRKTTKYDINDITVAKDFILGNEIASKLTAYNGIVKDGILNDNDMSDIDNDLERLTFVYGLDSNDVGGQKENFQKLFETNKDDLADVGISYDESSKAVHYNKVADMNNDKFKQAYNKLFAEDSVFGKSIIEYSKNAFYNIIRPNSLGISLIDEQL